MNPIRTDGRATGRRRSPWRRRIAAALPLAAFATVLWIKPMGLLLWARIRILTNIPRTAIAEPRPGDSFPDLERRDVAGADFADCEALALPDRVDPPADCEVGRKSAAAATEEPGTS
ncbi:MAG: hypothetical protein ACO3QA_07505 [Phycisphaerales bacterium]